MRDNLAYDRELASAGWSARPSCCLPETLQDIDYKNVNLRQTGTRPDGRPSFGRA